MLISCRRQSGRQINSFCMLFIGLFAMIPSDSCWKTMNSHGLFGLTHCIAGRDYPAAATCVKHLVRCMDAAFYIRLSAARCTESVILGKKDKKCCFCPFVGMHFSAIVIRGGISKNTLVDWDPDKQLKNIRNREKGRSDAEPQGKRYVRRALTICRRCSDIREPWLGQSEKGAVASWAW